MDPRFKRRMIRWGADEDGALSVEFALWMPLLVGILLLGVQVSALFATQASYGSVARDTARMIARHALSAEAAPGYAASRYAGIGGPPLTEVEIAGGRVAVTVSKPASEIIAIDPTGLSGNLTITSRAIYSLEPS